MGKVATTVAVTMTTSKSLYVYLQRPDTAAWVTVGRYRFDADAKQGWFVYAPSYLEAGEAFSIDPVHLPLVARNEFLAPRYAGLHDVLRDATPDAWGRQLVRQAHGLGANVHDAQYLLLSGNADRWGALAVGAGAKPSVAQLSAPRLTQLDVLSRELLAVSRHQPPVDPALRKRLLGTPSMGGARPKTTVRDGDALWLVKPALPTDVWDVPRLEHFCSLLARRMGLDFAVTALHTEANAPSVLRIKRFDRQGAQRLMVLSAATLLATEYPVVAVGETQRWSYPRLAEELLRIGVPLSDRLALFDRMVFNALVGNDDDHPRNHAVVFDAARGGWRLSPAYDVVPNPDGSPLRLAMQVSVGCFDINREAVLRDCERFGFENRLAAELRLNQLLAASTEAFAALSGELPADLSAFMGERLRNGALLLR